MKRNTKYLLVCLGWFGVLQCFAQSSGKTNDAVLNSQPMSFYISHKSIPQVCKDLYTGKRKPADDSDILSLMDSIFTSNKEAAPFYFLTLTRTMDKADGAYAEPLGMMAKSFVETRTKEFIDYFMKEPLLTTENFNDWARFVAGEIQISSAASDKQFGKLKAKLKSNCAGCGAKEKQLLNSFAERVEHYLP
jgi:hypothetical protein